MIQVRELKLKIKAVGSINLKIALIDDISFKNHKQKVEDEKNIIFLNPSDTENGLHRDWLDKYWE